MLLPRAAKLHPGVVMFVRILQGLVEVRQFNVFVYQFIAIIMSFMMFLPELFKSFQFNISLGIIYFINL